MRRTPSILSPVLFFVLCLLAPLGAAEITLTAPDDGALVSLAPPAQSRYLTPGERGFGCDYHIGELRDHGQRADRPLPIELAWRLEDGDAQAAEPAAFTVEVDTSDQFTDPITVTTAENSCRVDNLDIGTDYFWRVRAGGSISPVGHFTTAAILPRWIHLSKGIVNVRDAGYWPAAGNKRVKPGMIFRGGELDNHYELAEKSKTFLLEKLGIKTDFDLRGPGETGDPAEYVCPLGDNVQWLNFVTRGYAGAFTSKGRAVMRDIFQALARPEIYPIYLHCRGGADRTGTVIFLLQEILGVSDSDAFTDFELTTFSPSGIRYIRHDHAQRTFLELSRYGSAEEPLSVKCERYLLDIGVTPEEIAAIRATLLEDMPAMAGSGPVLLTPAEGESVSVAPPAAVPYRTPRQRGWDTDYPISEINPDNTDRTHPPAVTLRWSWPAPARFTVEVAAKEDFSDAIVLHSETTSVEVRNLAPGTLYHWRVTAGGIGGGNRSAAGHFRTEPQLPRWYDIPGIANVRDAGGWLTADGRRVKEGMVFRGTQLDGEFAITPEGRDYMVHTLGIKTDMDLRRDAEVGDPKKTTGRPLGDEVVWAHAPVLAYTDGFAADQLPRWREAFKVLARPQTYPVYIHCYGGADRTGEICLLLKAILGVSDSDLCADYELTTLMRFGIRYIHTDYFEAMIAGFNKYGTPEEPLSVKCERFLLDIGVTPEEIETIRATLLEDAPQAVPVLETPAEGESVSVAPPAAVPYQSPQERGWDTDYPIQQINPDGADRTQPKAVTLSWSWPEESYFTVELSAKEDFSEALILHSETTTVQARNLAPDTLYYWRVTAGGKCRSAVGHFRTEPQLPRWFDIPGASNVRDAGGWPTADGRRVKEGMIFRGTQLDGKHAITPEGRDYMVHTLGIKTDLDLRGPSEVGDPNVKTGRPLGDEVEWVNIPVAAYKDVFTEEGQRPRWREIFSTLAKPQTYPVYIHCWGGADRTGTLFLLLKGILGVSDNDLCADYELTTLTIFGIRYIHTELFEGMLEQLNRYGTAEEPMSVKCERFLLDIGVTPEEIESIRAILLEDQQ
ncbi:MAG: tyrosine-protein phosphatase [Thermoguttaceae bacterium]|nr:tyrosine-protein phosphatase [Thermoguttaceae bacterium]